MSKYDALHIFRKSRRAQNCIRRRAPALRAEWPHLDQDVERLNLSVILYGMEEGIGRERVISEDRFKMRTCSPVAVDFPCAPKAPELPHGVAYLRACGIFAALEYPCCGAGVVVCGADFVAPSSLDRLCVPESSDGASPSSSR